MLNSFVQEVGLCYNVVDRQMQTAVASFPFANLIVEWLKLKLITSMYSTTTTTVIVCSVHSSSNTAKLLNKVMLRNYLIGIAQGYNVVHQLANNPNK